MSVSSELGSRIRLYRQAKGISLAALSELVGKSKATLSKYENGEITIDIETLFSIADALEVVPVQLLQGVAPSAPKYTGDCDGTVHQYLYIYDGVAGRVTKSLLETTYHKEQPPMVTFFYNLPDFENPERCKALYYGTLHVHDIITNYSLQNQSTGYESVFMCLIRPFGSSDRQVGLISGIAASKRLPMSAKVVLCDEIQEETEEFINSLILTKDDFRVIRRSNAFMIDQLI